MTEVKAGQIYFRGTDRKRKVLAVFEASSGARYVSAELIDHPGVVNMYPEESFLEEWSLEQKSIGVGFFLADHTGSADQDRQAVVFYGEKIGVDPIIRYWRVSDHSVNNTLDGWKCFGYKNFRRAERRSGHPLHTSFEGVSGPRND